MVSVSIPCSSIPAWRSTRTSNLMFWPIFLTSRIFQQRPQAFEHQLRAAAARGTPR